MNVRKLSLGGHQGYRKSDTEYRKEDESFDHDADEFDERIPSHQSKSLERQPQQTFVNQKQQQPRPIQTY